MIGNDIVDLDYITTSTNWKRQGFLDKVFTHHERDYISRTKDQDIMVWRLWSMKESAYKAHARTFGGRFLNPKKLECRLISPSLGIVTIENSIYYTCTNFSDQYVHTEAKNREASLVSSMIQEYPLCGNQDEQSWNGYISFIQYISEVNNLKSEQLRIAKSKEGVPYVFNDQTKLPITFSLTHCGRFTAFSILNT